MHGSIFQISGTSKSKAFNVAQKKKNNKNTTERIYIPSLFLHCAVAVSLDVEAVAVTLRERRGSCSSSSSLSSTRQIKEIEVIAKFYLFLKK